MPEEKSRKDESSQQEEQNIEQKPEDISEEKGTPSEPEAESASGAQPEKAETPDAGISAEEAEAIAKGLEGIQSLDDEELNIPDLEKGGEKAEKGGEDQCSIDDLIASVTESSGFNFTSSSGEDTTKQAMPASFPEISEGGSPGYGNREDLSRMDMLLDIPVQVSVVLGRTRMTIGEVLSLEPGTVVELDALVGEPVEILANEKLILKGEVVVIDENFGIRVTEVVNGADKVNREHS